MSAPISKPAVMEMRVALTVSDYDRMVHFYCTGLGIDPAQLWTNEQGRAVILELGQATLEIFDEAQAAAVDRIEAGQRVSGQIRFAFQVPDLPAAVQRLVAEGAVLVHPAVITPWGDHNARLQAPDGMQITLFQSLEGSNPP